VKKVVVLGSTGSVGTQAIEVMRAEPDLFSVVGLVANTDKELLKEQARSLGVASTGLGVDAAIELAALPEADVVLNAIVGAAGLRASIAALAAGKTLALANKESLVAGGSVCLAAARDGGGTIVPVDSEHAAISQCLADRSRDEIARIVLTASGGPFRTTADLDGVTPEQALAHPTWSMGPKITVDSATLVNKGLELIEAHHLFDMPYDSLDVIVHPESVVHGMVVLSDGSTIMQAAPPDMKIPIRAALAGTHDGGSIPSIDLVTIETLHFEPVDHERFPAVRLAYAAGRAGDSHTTVLNAANEIAVEAFLAGNIRFVDIVAVIERTLEAHESVTLGSVDDVIEVDAWARREAGKALTGVGS
jgi:1-deoxy-D-xylulose-5-phosphate reductoisomerase